VTPYQSRSARLLFVAYGREETRINGNHKWLTSNVICWWTNKYGVIGNHREWWGVNPLVAASSPARPTLKFLVKHPGLPPLYSDLALATANVL
jgi:hypothetical protein